MSTPQLHLDLPITLPRNAYAYGDRASGETHGVVLTKPEVVGLILDLAGYKADRDLCRSSLLEPACGHGAFIVQAIERLMTSANTFGRKATELEGAISAFDIEVGHVDRSRQAVVDVLKRHGVTASVARRLAGTWIQSADFLLASPLGQFDFVVGNPP